MLFKPQKVFDIRNLSDTRLDKILKTDKGFLVTEKYEGWYGYIEWKNGKTEGIKAGSGRLIPSMQWYNVLIKKHYRNMPDSVLIFEIIIPAIKFPELNGILNKKYEQAVNAVLMVHDYVIDDSTTTYERYVLMLKLIKTIPQTYPIKKLSISNDKRTWKTLLNTLVNAGKEGIVLKQLECPYRPGSRIPELLKWKPKIYFDLEIIKFHVTLGEKGNEAWNMTLIRKNGIEIKVLIASYDLIDDFIKSENVVGKIAEISANEEYSSGKLRYPQFERIREDKNIGELCD